MDASHWIGSIAFELCSHDRQALDPVRRALKDDCDRILVRPLQRALDLADLPGRFGRHRRIEVDLGIIRPDNLGEVLAGRIAGAMLSQLRMDAAVTSPGKRSGDEGDLLLSFLESGLLAWPSPGKALEAISMALASRDHASLVRLAGRIQSLIVRLPAAAERFAWQCPLSLIFPIAAILAGMPWKSGPGSAGEIAYLGKGRPPRLAALLLQFARGEAVPGKEWQWLVNLIAGAPESGSTHAAQGAPVVPRAWPPPVGEQAAEISAAPPDPLSQVDCTSEHAAFGEALPLEAAGTVLIHPFVAGLFRATGLLDEAGEFLDDDASAHGVLLLHFAATGEKEPAEPELALAKLLCGLELSALIPRDFEPTVLEASEVAAVLEAAITHWRALGDTSPDALRETFLKRPGRLRREGEDWHLLVERRGVDILVDRLPWAISLVKTPFMARPLRVEWR